MAIDDFDFSSAAIMRRARDGVKRKAPSAVVPVIAPLSPKLTAQEIMMSQSIYNAPIQQQTAPPSGIPMKGKGWG